MSARHDARWTDAAAAYLLQAMEPEEASDFEAHLETCAACRRQVEELRVAVDALPSSPVQYEPSPELKDRVMSVVNAEARLLHAAGARADEPEGRPAARRGLAALRPGWWSVRPALALAGAVAVLAIGVLGGTLLSAGDGTRTVLAQSAPPGAEARLIIRDGGHSTLITDRMPDPGSGRVYQVWLKRGDRAPEPTNALFDVRSDGSASVDVPGRLDDVDAVLVTSEPGGGSLAPTRDPVLALSPA